MERRINRFGWLFIGIAVGLLALFMFYPLIYAGYLSLTSSKGVITTFVGLGNYKRLASDPVFILALKNTLLFFVLQVPLMLLVSLILATLLNDKKLKFKGVFRTAIFLPSVTSLIAYTILFKMIFSTDGLINGLLLQTNLVSSPIPFLQESGWARLVLVLAMTWRWTGYNMVFYLSAMQNIPEDIYEAAELDGSGKVSTFFRITVPLLRPMILFTTIMSTIGTLQLFDEPMNLSQGGVTASTIGPANALLTMSVYIYNLCFKYVPNFGYASAISYVVVFLIAILSAVQIMSTREKK